MQYEGTVLPGADAGFDYAIPRRLIMLDRVRGAVLCLTIIIATVAYSFRLTSFLHAKEAVFCVGIPVMALLVIARGQYYWNGVRAFAPIWLFVGAGLMRAALLPTAVGSDAAVAALRWVLLLVTVALAYDLLAQERWRGRITAAFTASAVAVAVLGYVQYFGLAPRLFPVVEWYSQRIYSVFGNQDYFGGYLAVALPVAAYTALGQPQRKWGIAAGILLIPALLMSGSRSAWLAAAVGLAVVAPHLEWRPRRLTWVAVLCAGIGAATVVMAPDATLARLHRAFAAVDEGRDTRIWLWQAGHAMFCDHPVAGVGLGNYAYCSPLYLGDLANTRPRDPGFDIERHADQPHSEIVRLLAETGLVGILLWAWMAGRLLATRGPAWGLLAAYGTFALFNGVFDSVPHTLAALLAAGMLLAAQPVPFWDSRGAANGLPVAAVAACLIQVWGVLTPSMWLTVAEDAQLAGRPHLRLYERAAGYRWPSARAHKQYADALADAGRNPEAYAEFRRALDGLDTGDLYLALAILATEENDLDAARQWIGQCVHRWPHNAAAREMFTLLYRREPVSAPPAAPRVLPPQSSNRAVSAPETDPSTVVPSVPVTDSL